MNHQLVFPSTYPQPQWLCDLREQSRERFAKLGLPTQRLEEWKYTSLRALEQHDFHPASATSASELVQPDLQLNQAPLGRLVFEAGRFQPALSSLGRLPEGVRVLDLATAANQPELQEILASNLECIGEHCVPQALQALNTAHLEDGGVIHIGRGVKLERPLEIRLQGGSYPEASEDSVSKAPAWYPRVLIVAGEHSAVTVLECHLGSGRGTYLSNSISEISVGAGAKVQHYKLIGEGERGHHLALTTAEVGRDASYANFVFIRGGALIRNQIRVVLAGSGASCTLNGAYTMGGRQHCDTHTLIEHAAAHCSSREVYKGTIDDRAKAIFQGKILVHPHAQQTDGYQLNRALLLSDRAEINSKPELEIHADDVKCSHGATAGALDDEALFYLRARGLERATAQNMLIEAFLREVLCEIEDAEVRELFLGTLERDLSAQRSSQLASIPAHSHIEAIAK